MTNFMVQFQTPKAVKFHEESHEKENVDMDLEAFIFGVANVSAYDSEKYSNEENVQTEITGNICATLRNCFDNWPEGVSVMRNDRYAVLTDMLKKEFASRGIDADITITGFNLTDASRESYMKIAGMFMIQGGPGVMCGMPFGNVGTPLPNPYMLLMMGAMNREFTDTIFPGADNIFSDGCTDGSNTTD